MQQPQPRAKRKSRLHDKRRKAFELYLLDWTQTDISDILDVSPQTVTDWKQADNWEQTKAEAQLPRATAEASIWRIINHNLRCLTAKIDVMNATGEMELISGGEIDALQRLLGRVKSDKVSDAQKIDVLFNFLDWLSGEHLELSQQLAPFAKLYINNLSK